MDLARDPAALPWFDQSDALARVRGVAHRWGLGRAERAQLRKWVTDGYFVVEDLIPHFVIDRFVDQVNSLWNRTEPLDGLHISGVTLDGRYNVHLTHSGILTLSLDVRRAAERASNWRVHGLHLFDTAADELFHWKRAQAICSAIFDRPAIRRYSITFAKGSQQAPHQDTCVFHVYPRNFLAGLWIACEDVKQDAGPLEFYPGSHREPLFQEFDNYPQTQRRTANKDQVRRYDQYVRDLTPKYPRRVFTAPKGYGLFGHGMLIHGGAPVTNPMATRKSFIVHFIPEGVDRSGEVEGPFNW